MERIFRNGGNKWSMYFKVTSSFVKKLFFSESSPSVQKEKALNTYPLVSDAIVFSTHIPFCVTQAGFFKLYFEHFVKSVCKITILPAFISD